MTTDPTPGLEGTPGAQGVADPSPKGAEPSPGSGSPGAAEAKFTQEDVDRLIGAKATQQLNKTLKDLGLEKVDDLKAIVAKARELEDATKSDLQKLTDKAGEQERRANDLEKTLQSERLTYRIERAAAQMGLTDPEVAAQLLDRDALELDDKGAPKKASLKKALEALVEERTWLKGSGTKPTGSADGGTKGTPAEGAPNMNDALRALVHGARE